MQRALLVLVFLPACAAPPPAADPPTPVGVSDPAFVRAPARAPLRFAPDLPRFAAPNRVEQVSARPAVTRFQQREVPGLNLDGEGDLRSIMGYLSAASGVDIVVDEDAQQALADRAVTFHLKLARTMSLTRSLELLQELSGDAFAWEWYGETALLVTTPDRVRRNPSLVVYEVSDLVRRIPSYAPRIPRFDVSPSGGLFPADEDEPEPVRVIDESRLVELIMNTIDPESWDEPGNSVTLRGGKLIVRRNR